MGLDISTPVEEWDCDDFADGLISLGEQYAPYADAVLDHRVDGSVLATLLPWEISESLRDLGIHNRVHRRFLQKKLLVLLHGPMDMSSAMDMSRSLSLSTSACALTSLSQSTGQEAPCLGSSASRDCRRRRTSAASQEGESESQELDSIREDDQGLFRALLAATAEQQKQEWKSLQARQLALQAQVAALLAAQ